MNPAILILLIPLITSIFSSVKNGVKDTANGKYNNVFLLALAAIALYLVVKGFNKSKQQTYLDTIGTDPASQQAAALRDAMNRSGIPVMMAVDGTDVDLIMQTAKQITDYTAVADSYRVIYKSELTLDLQSELSRTDLQKFYDIVYKRTTGTPTTSPTIVGKQVKAIQTVNVRLFTDYNKVDHQAKAGEIIGTCLGKESLFVSGSTGVFYIVESAGFVGLFKTKYYVLSTATTLL